MSFFTKQVSDGRGGMKEDVNEARVVLAGVGAVVGLILLLGSFKTIGPGERGVMVTMGYPSSTTLGSGFHFKLPLISSVKIVNVQIQAIETTTSSGTVDQQEVTTKAVVNLQVDETQASEIVKTVGSEEALLTRIMPQIQEAINANVSKFSAEEILTKRGQLKADIETMIKERCSKYGVIVHDLSIKDLQYSQQYAQAIEQKQIAEQHAKQAEYDAQRAIKEANAEVNKAKGTAEAQRLMKLTVTKEILQQQAIQKWDGKFPQFMGGGTLPFINMNMKGGE